MNPAVPRPDFPIDRVLDRVREGVAPYPPAVMFELAERGFSSLFQQVVACIVSIRTREEVTLPACLRLFDTAADAEGIAALAVEAVDRLIRPSTFHDQKTGRIIAIARLAVDRFDGDQPCTQDVVLGLPGVGPKCADLALGIACTTPHGGDGPRRRGGPTYPV